MRRVAIHRSLWKPILFMGCERIPFLIVAVTSGLLILEGNTWLKIAGIIYALSAIGAMALLNAREPLFFKIVLRYLKYQNFYANNAVYPGQADAPNNFRGIRRG